MTEHDLRRRVRVLLGPEFDAIQSHYQRYASRHGVFRLAGCRQSDGRVIHLSDNDGEPLPGLPVVNMPLDSANSFHG